MLFTARIGQKELSQLCRRLATGLEAGLDVRRVWSRETTGRQSPALRRRLEQVSDAVNGGDTLTDALAQTGKFFPNLFLELVAVGEQTGKLAEVLKRLAEHYEHQLKLRRAFLSAIAWPMLQLGAAICIIGLLIFVMGFITSADGKPIDILGFGLVGASGVTIYFTIIFAIAAAVALTIRAVRRGLAWTRPVQHLVLQIPVLGAQLQTLSLAQLAWTMHLTFDAGMDLLPALPLCLRSTGNARYTDHINEVLSAVRSGQEISEAFTDTRAFPRDFLDTLEVGERSGRLPETMAILSEQYQDQAQRTLAALTVIAGFGVWAIVAIIIVLMIFRLAMFYIGMIGDLSKPI
jgi:type II secretory pathway component PulF